MAWLLFALSLGQLAEGTRNGLSLHANSFLQACFGDLSSFRAAQTFYRNRFGKRMQKDRSAKPPTAMIIVPPSPVQTRTNSVSQDAGLGFGCKGDGPKNAGDPNDPGPHRRGDESQPALAPCGAGAASGAVSKGGGSCEYACLEEDAEQ
eukprot:s1907_g8.t1